jgi:heme-degrading monooxygenase HmoA
MIAVIFEVEPHPGLAGTYLALAAELRSRLEKIEGFISIERFRSLADDNRMLSLSYWRDEDAVRRWRELEAHRAAQREGRARIFARYRLRVAEVLRDYGDSDRREAPR